MILLLYKQHIYNLNVLKVDSISKQLGKVEKYLYTIQALPKLNKKSNKIIIRTMMSGKTPKALKYLAHMPQSNSTGFLRSAYTRYYAKYSVYDTRVNNQSYENIKKNPIIEKNKKIILHPTICKETCNENSCPSTMCEEQQQCQPTTSEFVGHVTHSSVYGSFIASFDLDKKQKTQYIKKYKDPIKVEEYQKESKNDSRTANLDNNKEMKLNIHIETQQIPHKESKPTEYSSTLNIDENIN